MCNEYISLVSFLSNILASIGTADGLALGAAAGLRKVEVELIIFLAIMLHKVGGKIDVSLFVVVIAVIFSRPLQPLVSHLFLFSRCVNSAARLLCTFGYCCWPLCISNIFHASPQGHDRYSARKHLLAFALAAPVAAFLSYFGLVRVRRLTLSPILCFFDGSRWFGLVEPPRTQMKGLCTPCFLCDFHIN